MKPTGPEKLAFIQGQQAARDGKEKTVNPYRIWLTPKSICYADAWDVGFDEIKNAEMAQEER